MFEIEFRGKLKIDDYNRVNKFLDENGRCLGQDDKDTVFYIFPDRLLKLVHNISKGDAKISLKLNRIGEGSSFKETEFHFSEKDFSSALEIFKELSLSAKVIREPQRRINYIYSDCEIALKYSDTWGYHFEIEKMIDSEQEQASAEVQILKVAEELKIKIMTEDELKKFVKSVENRKDES